MESPWDRAKKTQSQRQEERLAKLPEGAPQVNSGRSTWTSKRDTTLGRIYKFLVEARTTNKGSYSISKNEFLDLRKQAIQTPPGLLPGIQVDIQDLELWVMDFHDWQEFQARMTDLEEMIDAINQENGQLPPVSEM